MDFLKIRSFIKQKLKKKKDSLAVLSDKANKPSSNEPYFYHKTTDMDLKQLTKDHGLLKFIPGGISFGDLKKIEIQGKDILLVVAHADDELIFSSSVLTANNWKSLKIILVFDPGHRLEAFKKLCKLINANFHMLMLPETQGPKGATNQAPISQEMDSTLRKCIGDELLASKYSVVFTHNFHGEYGHGHHRFVSEVVFSEYKKIKLSNTEYFQFGYVPPVFFRQNGITPWYESLICFSKYSPWLKFRDVPVDEFHGLFSFKKFPGYFYFETNSYLPIKDRQLLQSLINCYIGVEDWWMHTDSYLWEYCNYSIQYFQQYQPEIKSNLKPICYKWPVLDVQEYNPITAKNPELANIKKDFVRSFHDSFLLEYLRPSGTFLWIGWNEYCFKNGYFERISNLVKTFHILDKSDSRGNNNIYQNTVATHIGDLQNLKDVIQDNQYDFIHCWGVLEYVDSVQNSVDELFRITKNQGRVLVGMPGQDWDMTGKNRITYDEWIKMVQIAGFFVIEIWRNLNPDYFAFHLYKPSGIDSEFWMANK